MSKYFYKQLQTNPLKEIRYIDSSGYSIHAKLITQRIQNNQYLAKIINFEGQVLEINFNSITDLIDRDLEYWTHNPFFNYLGLNNY